MNRKLLLFLLVAIAGCSRSVDKAELPGLYSVESDSLKQEITIRADGKYVNAFYRDGKLAWSDQGDWAYEEQKGKTGTPSHGSDSVCPVTLPSRGIGSFFLRSRSAGPRSSASTRT